MQKSLFQFIPPRLLSVTACFWMIMSCTGLLYAAQEYEPLQVLNTADVLPKFFFESDLYTIDQQVKNDGLMNTYRVTSKHGDFVVTSTVALYKLIGEIEAIDAMKRVEESDTFTKSLKESGTNVVEGVKQLFTSPVESVKGAGTGLSSLFFRAQEAIFESDPGETEDSRVKQLVGFSKSKRELAHKFHVDVYSTNEVLQDQLNTLAWADYGGGITLSIATLPLAGPVKVVYSSSNVVRLLNDAIAMTPPSELKKQNREKLAMLKMDMNLTDLFINNPHLSPRQQTYIVAALELMSEASRREVALMVALQVNDADMAVVVTSITMMQAGYNNNVAKIKELTPAMRIWGAVDSAGTRILLVPVDYLTWNDMIAGAVGDLHPTADKSKREIWLLGSASPLAQARLKDLGWTVKIKVAEKIGISEIGLLETE